MKITSKQTILTLMAIITFLFAASFVIAGPVSEKDITFHLAIPQTAPFSSKLSQQNNNWRLSFISIGEFNKDGWNFTDYNATQNYLQAKEDCGADSSFHEIVYEMSQEERQHKGCVINGTYQEVYCFKTISDNPACQNLAEYKLNDHKQLTFDSYYNSYVWDIQRADQYHHFAASSCNIINGTCSFLIDKNAAPYNPYVVVLERLNSSEVYFSGPISIEQTDLFSNETLFDCNGDGCDVHVSADTSVTEFKTEQPHKLIISLSSDERYNVTKADEACPDAACSESPPSTQNILSRFWNWITHLFS